MISATGIIKKSQVKSVDRLRLLGPNAGQGDAAAIEARLLSSDESGAVIEIICKCGERFEVVCEYATSDQGPTSTGAAAVQEYGETQ